TFFRVFSDEVFHVATAAICNDLRSRVSAAFQHSEHNSFSVVARRYSRIVVTNFVSLTLEFQFAAFVHVAGFAADETLIDFDRRAIRAAEFYDALALQSKAKPMQHEPRGLLGDAKITGNFVAADAVLAVHQHPQRDKPLGKRNRGFFKDGAEFHGELFRALFALPAFLGFEVVVLFIAASRTLRAIRPAQRGYGINADLFV